MAKRPSKVAVRHVLVGIRLVEALPGIVQGLVSYIRERQLKWQLRCVDADEFSAILQQDPPDGAIAVIARSRPDLLELVRGTRVPVVNMLHDCHPQLPSVLSDDAATGRAAAEYFVGRGHRHFAYLGFDAAWSHVRQGGYQAALAAAGLGCYLPERLLAMKHYRFLETRRCARLFEAWIARLPKPLALFVCADPIASTALEILTEAGVRVPEEVAVVGVGNLVATCELAPVALSTIATDFPALGYQAASVLDRIMAGGKPPTTPIVLPPASVVARRSSDAFMFEDEHVRAAMRIIHERAVEGLTMKELLRQVPVSQKWLNLRFNELVGRTASAEIRRLRLERVRELLVTTDLSAQQIARLCGFSQSVNLIRFFRDGYGTPPSTYRARYRVRA